MNQEQTKSHAGLNIDEIKKNLRHDEGFSLKVYPCSEGKKTIGYGHNIDAKGLPIWARHFLDKHGCINLEIAEDLLDLDLCDAIDQTMKNVPLDIWTWLTIPQRGALVEITFNMGEGWFQKFHSTQDNAIDHLFNKDMESFCKHLKASLWYRQLGGDPEGTDDHILERPERLIAVLRKG